MYFGLSKERNALNQIPIFPQGLPRYCIKRYQVDLQFNVIIAFHPCKPLPWLAGTKENNNKTYTVDHDELVLWLLGLSVSNIVLLWVGILVPGVHSDAVVQPDVIT